MKPPSYPESTNLISGTGAQRSRRGRRRKKAFAADLPWFMSFVFWSPLTRSSTLKLLSQGTPQACLVSPWVPSISISSLFWAQTKLILSWQLESKLVELIGASLCLTNNSYACLFSMSAFKKNLLQTLSSGWTSGTETDRNEKYSWGWEGKARMCRRRAFNHLPINTATAYKWIEGKCI